MAYSALTTGLDGLKSAALGVLSGAGYAFNPLTTSLNQHLAASLTGLGGSNRSHLTMSRVELLAALVNTAGAVTVSHLTSTEAELWALLAGSTFNAGSPDAGAILMEDGSYILMEDGSKILLEA